MRLTNSQTIMNWDYLEPYTSELNVTHSDIDGMGHANNTCYAVWCENCAWKHSEDLGLTLQDYQRLDRGVVVHKASYNYLLPAFENNQLMIATWLTNCDYKLRLERRFQIINLQTKQTLMKAHWLLICTVLSTGKPAHFPSEFTEVYGSAVIPST